MVIWVHVWRLYSVDYQQTKPVSALRSKTFVSKQTEITAFFLEQKTSTLPPLSSISPGSFFLQQRMLPPNVSVKQQAVLLLDVSVLQQPLFAF
jgi:hypothetical protein